MIRNLKVCMLAALALLAVGAVSAASASAAEFTVPGAVAGEVTTITSTEDGTGTTAHHVFDVPNNGSITCPGVTLHGSITGPSTPGPVTLTAEYTTGCKFLGQNATVELTHCDFTFWANGTGELMNHEGQTCLVHFSAAGCSVTLHPQHFTGITYHNIGAVPNTEITASAAVNNLTGTAAVGCPVAGAFTTGQYTTGNVILTGSKTDASKAMREIKIDTP
jgi:hypothetical protein